MCAHLDASGGLHPAWKHRCVATIFEASMDAHAEGDEGTAHQLPNAINGARLLGTAELIKRMFIA